MANADFTYTVGFQGDATNLSTTIQNFSAGLKSKPLVVPIQGGQLSVANSAELAKTIDKNAVGLQKMTINMKEFVDAGGNKVMIATSALATFSDGVAQTSKKLEILADKKKIAAQALTATGGKGTYEYDPGKQTAEYEKVSKALTGMSSAAEQFMSKSQSMSGKQVDAAKQTATALIAEKKAYDNLFNTGQFDKLKAAEANVRKLNDQFKLQEAATKRAATGLQGWASTMTNAIKQTLAYTTTLGAMRAAQQLLNDGIQFTIELNKEMVAIQVLQAEGAQTPEEISALAGNFNELAKQMGVSTIEVAKGSVEWLRQGRSIKETTELLRASTMLSKLGNLEASEATEYLTSTVNSYKIAVEDTVSVVDKLVAVDNNSATSSRELATALRYTAATAAEAGVSLDELISYVATMSSVTRINAESIGQSMKTILTRMQDIKAGKIDEDGLGLNNVESALQRIGVPLRDSATSFRDLGGVLEDVAAKWDTLNEIEQANISKAIAGVRQANLFKVLMSNMGDALKYQEIEAKAAGTAMDRYQIYLQGVEAAQNRMKASVESLWMDSIKSGLIVQLLNATTKIINFIEAIGGLKTAIAALAISFALLKLPQIVGWLNLAKIALANWAVGVETATVAVQGLGISMQMLSTVGIGLAITAVATLAFGLYQLSQRAENAKKSFEEASAAASQAAAEYADSRKAVDTVKELWTEYVKLRDTIIRTEEEQQRFVDIQNQINDLSGGNLEGTYSAELDFRISDIALITDTVALLEQEVALRQQIALDKEREAANAGDKAAQANLDKIKDLKAEQAAYAQMAERASAIGNDAQARDAKRQVAIKQQEIDSLIRQDQQYANDALALYRKLTTAAEKKDFLTALSHQKSIETIKNYDNDLLSANERRMAKQYKPKPVIIPVKMNNKEFMKQVYRIEEEVKNVTEAVQNIGAGTNIEKSTATLNEMGIQWDVINGKVVINQESLARYYQLLQDGALSGIDATEEQANAMDKVTGKLTENIAGVEMTQQEYQYLASDISSSMWSAADGAGMALTALNGKQITSSAQLKSIILSSAAEFQNIVTQMTQKNMLDLDKLAAYAMQILSMFGGSGITPSSSGVFRGGGGGGGGAQENPNDAEIKAQEKKIKNLERKKKALEDSEKAYKKYIDAQKESLKIAKEENDYNDKIAEKSKSLAKLKTQIAILSLDQSKSALAKRLQLEEQAAKISTEILKEQEDREYDLKIDAYDKMEKAFSESIDRQIEAIELMIDKIKELIEVLKNALELKDTVAPSSYNWRQNVQQSTGTSVTNMSAAAAQAYAAARNAQIPGGHSGGLAYELHHDGDFAGNLKSNEVYAKLLKGEYVATEGQMANFMKNILPKIANITAQGMVQSKCGDSNNFNISLNVAGNLDKISMQDVEKKVYASINKALRQRGKKSNVINYSV